MLLITLIRSLKFDVVFNFDVIEEISTELTEVPGVLCVEEQKTVSTPGINILTIIDLTQYYSQPVDNLILHLLDEELGDGDGGEDHVRLGDSRTERELGEGGVHEGVDILEVGYHQLTVVHHGLVPRAGLGLVVLQDGEGRGHHSENQLLV